MKGAVIVSLVAGLQECLFTSWKRIGVAGAANRARKLRRQALGVHDAGVVVAAPADEGIGLMLCVYAPGPVTRLARDAELRDDAVLLADKRPPRGRVAGDAVRAPTDVVLRRVWRLEECLTTRDEAPLVGGPNVRKHVERSVLVLGP